MSKKVILPKEIHSVILSKAPIQPGDLVQPLYVTDTRQNFDVAYVDSISLTSFAETIFMRRLNWLSFFTDRNIKVLLGTYIVNLRFSDGSRESCGLEYVAKFDGSEKEDSDLNDILIYTERRYRLENFFQIVTVMLLSLLFVVIMGKSFTYIHTECLRLIEVGRSMVLLTVLSFLFFIPVVLFCWDIFSYILDLFSYPFRLVRFRK